MPTSATRAGAAPPGTAPSSTPEPRATRSSRTSPEQRITVVATGEGADEVFWGYDLFKEVAIREIHERDPERALSLLDGLYAHLGDQGRRGAAWHRAFLDAGAPGDPVESHLSRA